VEKGTVQIYEENAEEWRRRRTPTLRQMAHAFSTRVPAGAVRVDLGCGPGSYVDDLGRPLVALDAALAMVDLARKVAPDIQAVQADLEALPFRRGSLGGAWARASYLHVPRARLPMALARLQDSLAVGAPVLLTMRLGDIEGAIPDDDFAGRFFAEWNRDDLTAVVQGAGFVIDKITATPEWIHVAATRDRTLPDFVGPGMRVLVCGLNPSLIAAEAGFGYATPSNRFWRAAIESGLVSTPRNPWAALARDHVGMTDLVKRATPRSRLLTKAEYRAGAARVHRLVEWLEPQRVMFVGLEGWRAAVNPKATPGPQPVTFGGAPAYVMPSTSGLNASTQIDGLITHMHAALTLTQVGNT
jgi:TDG/mug DNA glycosylase family protein